MSMIASMPQGLAQVGWRRLALTAAAFCLAPALVGGVIVGLGHLFGPGFLGADHLRLLGMATFALVSPLFGAPIWAVIALGAAGLLRSGMFGWLPTALLGMMAFGILARTEIGPVAVPFGAASALFFRMALALQRPMAF